MNGYSCHKGLCTPNSKVNVVDHKNECKPDKGVFAFIVGLPELGIYNNICKSIDLGIAPNNPNQQNKMCLNGDIDINYSVRLPSLEDCDCGNNKRLVIPATSTVREHIVCL